MKQPYKVLDLYCGVGGASMGYNWAGCEVTGIDKVPQPNYPFNFIQDDVISYLQNNDVSDYDFIHASPPCQEYSIASAIHRHKGKKYDDLLGITRDLLQTKKNLTLLKMCLTHQ